MGEHVMNNDSFDSLLPSRFLKQADVDPPVTLTIKGFNKGTLKNKAGVEEPATFVAFEETEKQVPYKTWTAECLKEIFPDGLSSCVGQKVEVYRDPKIMMGAEKKGGIRIRAAKASTPF
jgi:hypothetical protein